MCLNGALVAGETQWRQMLAFLQNEGGERAASDERDASEDWRQAVRWRCWKVYLNSIPQGRRESKRFEEKEFRPGKGERKSGTGTGERRSKAIPLPTPDDGRGKDQSPPAICTAHCKLMAAIDKKPECEERREGKPGRR